VELDHSDARELQGLAAGNVFLEYPMNVRLLSLSEMVKSCKMSFPQTATAFITAEK
jgi:hypothetical protein